MCDTNLSNSHYFELVHVEMLNNHSPFYNHHMSILEPSRGQFEEEGLF